MKKFRLLKLGFLIAMLLGVSTVFSQQDTINPINILMPPEATACGIYDIDLNVQQYINIANISMTLELNSLVSAGAYTGITLNPVINGAFAWVNPEGQLKLGWSSDPNPDDAITLPDNTVLFTLHFTVTPLDYPPLWGTSHYLAWNDVLTIDCELSGPDGDPIYPDYWNNLQWIIQNELAIDSATITPYACPTNPMGAIDLHISNGVPPYTYAWTGPNGFTATTQDLTGLFTGDYYVTVTDADYCVVDGGPYTVVEDTNVPPPVIPITNGSDIVECLSDIVIPTPPVVEDYCGTVLTPVLLVIDLPDPITCEGTRVYRYTYTDYLNQSSIWTYTYTIDRTTFPAEVAGPAATASTVECVDDAVAPTLPVIADVCGFVLDPTEGTILDPNPLITDSPDPLTCEGTRTYEYTYTDCSGLKFAWIYTYTIERTTPPAEVGGPVAIESTVECAVEAVAPTLPVFEDVCGVVLSPDPSTTSGTYVDCEGTYIYTYTYTDCAGLATDWVYTYTIDDNTAPTIIAPNDTTVYMNAGCTAVNPDIGTPVVADNCYSGVPPPASPTYSNDAPTIFPEGSTLVTWTVEDCAGNVGNTDTQWVTVIRNNLTGKLHYNNIYPFGPPIIMNNVDITLYDDVMTPLDTVTTDYQGNYSFTELCAGTFYVEITNNNKPPGGVNITDAGQVFTYGDQEYIIEKVRWLAGDVNGNSTINFADAGKILNHFVLGEPFEIPYWNYYWFEDSTTTNTAPGPMSVDIGGGNANMDIRGQCTGDFNGNFAPGVMKSASESLTLDYRENMLVSSDSEFELPVYAGIDMEVGAVSLIMNFPADKVEITNVFLTSDPSSPLLYNVVGNELRIGWYSLAPVWLNEGESLITLQMKLKTELAEEIQFSLVSSELNELADGNFNVIGNAAMVIDIPSTSALGIGLNLSAEEVDFTSYPNPFKGTTTLTYSLPSDGQVLIEVYDLVGSKVKVAIDETQSAGEYSLKLDVNHLQSGIYTAILKLTSDDKVTTRAIKMINR